MGVGELLLWLGKVLGGEAIKARLGQSGLRRELRVLKQALEESQNDRTALRAGFEAAARIARERDGCFAELVRVRIENVELRAELERLRRD